MNNKKIPWHQNVKWWHLLLISIVSWYVYYPDNGILWNFIFLIAFIFSIIQFLKEDYFSFRFIKSKIVKNTLLTIIYIIIFSSLVILTAYIKKEVKGDATFDWSKGALVKNDNLSCKESAHIFLEKEKEKNCDLSNCSYDVWFGPKTFIKNNDCFIWYKMVNTEPLYRNLLSNQRIEIYEYIVNLSTGHNILSDTTIYLDGREDESFNLTKEEFQEIKLNMGILNILDLK